MICHRKICLYLTKYLDRVVYDAREDCIHRQMKETLYVPRMNDLVIDNAMRIK